MLTTPLLKGEKLFYAAFAVDVLGLDEGYNIHFDLYNVVENKKGNLEVGIFAPFSHDAQSGGDGGGGGGGGGLSPGTDPPCCCWA